MIPEISPYTFGSMSLGNNPMQLEPDIRVARAAMDAGSWFHSSCTYQRGFSFMILRMAFDQDRAHTPKMILKIRDGSAALMRFETEDSLQRLGLESLHIAQLVSMDPEPGNLVDQLRGKGGPLVDELASLKDRGLIRHAVLYINKGNADAVVEAAEHPLIDGVTFYFNALQRDCTDHAWTQIQSRKIPVLALRTLGGWRDERLNSKREAISAALPDLDPVQLALDLAASTPEIKTTIGGTASETHLKAYLDAAARAKALSAEAQEAVERIRA